MITLTIAIPTYNRVSSLRKQLELLDTLKETDIEFLISDNFSDDGTEEMVCSFISRNQNFRYQRQHANLGFDENIKSLYLSSKGKYIWFLSDDDLINPTEISPILETLRKNKDLGAVCLLLNGKGNVHKSRVVSYANFGKKVTLLKHVVIEIVDSKSLRTNFGTLVSQISTCIIAKEDLVDLQFSGGGIAHVVICQRVLNYRNRVLLMDSRAVTLSSKETITSWFLESCLRGTQIAYDNLVEECGEENSRLVSEATRALGLRIAFWNLASISKSINMSLITDYAPPRILRLRAHYVYWYCLIRLGLHLPYALYLLTKLRNFVNRAKQKSIQFITIILKSS